MPGKSDNTRLQTLESLSPGLGNKAAQLMIVVDRAILDAATFKWTYQVRPAIADASAPFGAVAKTSYGTTTAERALSVSELGNTTSFVCGGVPVGDLLGSFEPKPLHIGCAVWCVAARDEDGLFYWAITSPTQSISGAC